MRHTNNYHVTEIDFKDYKDEILSLRQRAWEQTDFSLMKQVFTNGFHDEYDDCAFHWGILSDDKTLIASARLSKHNSQDSLPDHHLLNDISTLNFELPIGSLNRLSVDKKYQGRGYSKLFDEIRVAKAIEIGCKSVCGMTYGHRGLKLLHDGFFVYPLLTISIDFKTDKENAKELPPSFYYKTL